MVRKLRDSRPGVKCRIDHDGDAPSHVEIRHLERIGLNEVAARPTAWRLWGELGDNGMSASDLGLGVCLPRPHLVIVLGLNDGGTMRAMVRVNR